MGQQDPVTVTGAAPQAGGVQMRALLARLAAEGAGARVGATATVDSLEHGFELDADVASTYR